MSDNCPFCKLIKNKEVAEAGDTGVYYFEPLNPVTKGHRLFVPKEHYSNAGYHPAITGLVVGQAVEYARIFLNSDYNLIINNGKAASQTVGHLHVHIVPRVEGDGLILPWTNQDRDWTQTIYEAMEDVPVDHLVTVDAARENSDHIAKQLKTRGVV